MANAVPPIHLPCNQPNQRLVWCENQWVQKEGNGFVSSSTHVQAVAKSFFEECVRNWCVPISHLAFGARSIYAARGIGASNPWLGSLRMFEGLVLVADGWLRIRSGAEEFFTIYNQSISIRSSFKELGDPLVRVGVGVILVVSGVISTVVTTILLIARTAAITSVALARLLYGVSVVVALVQLTRIATHLYNVIEITKFSHQLEADTRDGALKALERLREPYLVVNYENRGQEDVLNEFHKKTCALSERVSDLPLCHEIQNSAGLDEGEAKVLLNKIFFNATKHRVEEMMCLLFSIAHLIVNVFSLVGGPLITMTYAILYACCSAFLWVLVDMELLRNAIGDGLTALLLKMGLVYQIQERENIASPSFEIV